MKLILVCGPIGAGKTTYSKSLANRLGAVKFSIDTWMQSLFQKDMTSLDYDWMQERVDRCHSQIWEVSDQVLKLGGTVVLDLSFTSKIVRKKFCDWAKQSGVVPELHYLSVPEKTRRERVKHRNLAKNPDVYAFEVTDFMFDFMEKRFEIPSDDEQRNGFVLKEI